MNHNSLHQTPVKTSNGIAFMVLVFTLIASWGCQSTTPLKEKISTSSQSNKIENTESLTYKENSSKIVETSSTSKKDENIEDSNKSNTPKPALDHEAVVNKYGVKIESLRLTAGGYLIDFRYRIIDPDKANFLLNKSNKPLLTDPISKFKATVPVPAKVGALRSSGKLIKDRVYFMLFANPAQYLKAGQKVTIEFGEMKVENVLLLGGKIKS